MEDIIQKIKEYEKLHAQGESTQTEKNEKEVAATSETRLQALETFGESKKKKLLALRAKHSEEKCKKSRSSWIDYLKPLT